MSHDFYSSQVQWEVDKRKTIALIYNCIPAPNSSVALQSPVLYHELFLLKQMLLKEPFYKNQNFPWLYINISNVTNAEALPTFTPENLWKIVTNYIFISVNIFSCHKELLLPQIIITKGEYFRSCDYSAACVVVLLL